MGKKSTSKRSKRPAPPVAVPESQAAEALTVGWSLSVVTVALCDVLAALTRLFAAYDPEQKMVAGLSGLLFFAAAILGLLVLLMTPLVYRVRREPPPRGFVAFALIVATAPLVIAVWQAVD